ncbi:hypothetical protein CHS0354_031388 [Potamilus streckersoni]|uniref:Uncharacterized protein n=1 Tax=Potamilus streckersoni TaxID=2493646 RepID=A0AAE0VXY6_9BIVA|nr:hypothetical protein CHS0354_031388 [Potamilus streckersoni]
MDSVECKSYTVKSTSVNAVNIAPYKTITINGIASNVDAHITQVITENLGYSGHFTVCPVVTRVGQQGSYSKVQVNLCNMSAKCVTVYKFDVCILSEVKVVDHIAYDFSPRRSENSSHSTLEDLKVYSGSYFLQPNGSAHPYRLLWALFFSILQFSGMAFNDQRRNFEDRVINKPCKLEDVQKSLSSPFHPHACEFFNGTLLKMLGTLEKAKTRLEGVHCSNCPCIQY